jgi:hypothetical protein
MSEVVLHCAQIDAGVREVVPARVPQHVWMHIFETSTLPCCAHQVIDGAARHRLPTLGNEEPRQLVGASCQVPLYRAQLFARNRLLDGQRILQTLHPDARLREVQLIASQTNGFADAQPMPIHHQHQKVVTRAMPAALRRLEQSFNFFLIQEILSALVRVGRADRGRVGLPHTRFQATLYITPFRKPLSTLQKPASHIG